MENIRILYVEDDIDLRNFVKASLPPNVHFTEVKDVIEAKASIKNHSYDIILVDLFLEGESGFTLIEFINQNEFISIPIIMIITSSSEDEDEVHGHQLDVEEYIRKPLKPKVFKAIIEKHLKKIEQRSNIIRKVGPLRIDPRKMQVKMGQGVKDDDLSLTLKEYKLLMKFLDNPRIAYTREQLFEQVWDASSELQSRTIDMHVSALRKKLGLYGQCIYSVRGVGYSFDPDKALP